jgi:RNA polymerase sigma factor (sigma-70 family)
MLSIHQTGQEKSEAWDADEIDALATKARGGDEAAFENLLKQLRPMIYSIIGRYSYKVGNDPQVVDEARDGAEERVVEALQSWDAAKGHFSSHVYNWISGRVNNIFRRHILVRKKEKPFPVQVSEETGQEETVLPADPRATDPENFAVLQERFDLIEGALDELDERSSALVRMFFGRGGYKMMTYPEIAEEVGLSVTRVRGIIGDALRRLSRSPRLRSFGEDIEHMPAKTDLRRTRAFQKTINNIVTIDKIREYQIAGDAYHDAYLWDMVNRFLIEDHPMAEKVEAYKKMDQSMDVETDETDVETDVITAPTDLREMGPDYLFDDDAFLRHMGWERTAGVSNAS